MNAATFNATIPTHFEFCGQSFPRKPEDIARDRWIAERLPVVVDAIAQVDASLMLAFSDMRIEHAALDAFRSNDDAELGRLVRAAVLQRLAEVADLQVEEEAYERFPEERL